MTQTARIPAPPAPPFGITVCGIEELAGHRETGASHVLSILDPDHPVPEAFGRYGEHAKVELRFHDIVTARPGEILPQEADVDRILALGRSLDTEATGGSAGATHLLVHCHLGISRSTAAMALILAQAMPRTSEADILRIVHRIRPQAWPNLLLVEIGDRRLGRDGRLVAAASALHRLQSERQPHLPEVMSSLGREREVEAARRSSPLDDAA